MADVMQPPKGGEPDTPEQKKPVPLVNDGLSPSDVDFIPPLVHSLVTSVSYTHLTLPTT